MPPRFRLVAHPSARIPWLPPPALSVTLVKDDRTRLYWIRPTADLEVWRFQIVWNGNLEHRGATVDYHQAERLYAEFTREIADAKRDGWTVAP